MYLKPWTTFNQVLYAANRFNVSTDSIIMWNVFVKKSSKILLDVICMLNIILFACFPSFKRWRDCKDFLKFVGDLKISKKNFNFLITQDKTYKNF